MIKGKRAIFIIEDDKAINSGIELTLGKDEYEFRSFYRLCEVDDIEKADLIILDVNLPDGNGLDFLRDLRKKKDTPVLVLTANDTELDEVAGLSLGADDYVTKPFSLMALRLRVKKLLERADTGMGEKDSSAVYEGKSLYLDFDRLMFLKNGVEIDLSKTEIRLLKYLVANEGITLSRERLMDFVWNNQQYVDENALSVSIKRLRDKIEGRDERLIHTVYGIGYVFKGEGRL
ncbi:MAG: response regulator transcription factor [Lentihominibacter sp.]